MIHTDQEFLLCPKCDSGYIHHVDVRVLHGPEEDGDGVQVDISTGGKTCVSPTVRKNMIGRRNTVLMSFFCEECNGEMDLSIMQSEGNTVIEWMDVSTFPDVQRRYDEERRLGA